MRAVKLASTSTPEQWRRARRYLNAHRHGLAQQAARLYPDHIQVGLTGLLTNADWVVPEPVPIDNVSLSWSETAPPPLVDGTEEESTPLRPNGRATGRFTTYAEALGELARPSLFENRPCYRLLSVSPAGNSADLSFGIGTYFDVINTCEAVAHELAAVAEDRRVITLDHLPFRSLIGDPLDLSRRAVLPAISALTIRRGTHTEAPRCVLHMRDGESVAHGGGLYQVMPVGVFQPAGNGPTNQATDFDLWRSMAREYSEEFLGQPEHRSSGGGIDYDNWGCYQTLTNALHDGTVTGHWMGLGIDPLSLVADLLVVAVFDGDMFDALFPRLVTTNEEGTVINGDSVEPGAVGLPFTEATVRHFIEDEPMQAAGAALLQLTWEHRHRLGLRR